MSEEKQPAIPAKNETTPAAPEVEAVELDEEAAAAAFAADEDGFASKMDAALGSDDEAPPNWASLPDGLKEPPEGTQIAFMQIPAAWTRTPAKGDRVLACWPIGETEELLAYQRSRGSRERALSELTKAAVRMIDGHKADWSTDMNKPGSVMRFWSEIGPKGRAVVRNWYIRTHNVSDEEALDFFSKRFVNVTVRRG